MKTTKEMIEVMSAFAHENKPVQYSSIDFEGWFDCPSAPTWNWHHYDYRIKPETKKRPMTFEEIICYWKEHRTEILTVHSKSGYVIRHGTITSVNDTSETISVCEYFYDVIEFCQFVTKEDGSRFEIDETES